MGKITEKEAKEFEDNLTNKSSELFDIVFTGVFKWAGGWVDTVCDNLRTEREAKRRWEEECRLKLQEEKEAKLKRMEAAIENLERETLAIKKEIDRRNKLEFIAKIISRVIKFSLVTLLIAGAIIGGIYIYKMLS